MLSQTELSVSPVQIDVIKNMGFCHSFWLHMYSIYSHIYQRENQFPKGIPESLKLLNTIEHKCMFSVQFRFFDEPPILMHLTTCIAP